jgi:hypothetical protein
LEKTDCRRLKTGSISVVFLTTLVAVHGAIVIVQGGAELAAAVPLGHKIQG